MSTTKSPVHLKPGEIVTHREHGFGVVSRFKGSNDAPHTAILHHGPRDWYRVDTDLTGWERVETVQPGHVQVRVDDLDLDRWAVLGEHPEDSPSGTVTVRAARALAAQRAESTPPADAESELPPVLWDRHNVKWEHDEGELYVGGGDRSTPDCAMRHAHLERLRGPLTESPLAESTPPDEQLPDTATVKLCCPHGCGGTVKATVGTTPSGIYPGGESWVRISVCPIHKCPPVQPDEPTEFGARVTVDGERWVRVGDGPRRPWRNRAYDVASWGDLCERGPAAIDEGGK